MRKLNAFSVFFFFLCCPLFVNAAEFAIVDADYLMNEAVAAKDIKRQLKTQREAFQSEFRQTESGLKQEEQALLIKRATLEPQAFQTQIKGFADKMQAEQAAFQQRKQGLDIAFSTALKDLQKEIGTTIQTVAKQDGYDLVLSKQSILYAAAGQKDITQAVLTALNARVKTIDVKF